MRTFGWSLASLLAAAPLLAQQQPPGKQAAPVAPAPPPPPAAAPRVVAFDPERDPLDKLLLQWEQKMKGLQSLLSPVVRIETDAVLNDKTVYEGTVKLLRPNRADLYLAKKGNPNIYDRYLCTGNYLYEFRPAQKLIRVHTLPQKAPGQPALDDGFLNFLFGLDAKDLKKRYDIALLKQDQWYAYLLVKSVQPGDRAEFAQARLAILLQSMLPAQMIFVPPNGNEVEWKLGPVDTARALGPADFEAPKQLPKDWQMQQVPAARAAVPPPSLTPASAPPTKVRQAGS